MRRSASWFSVSDVAKVAMNAAQTIQALGITFKDTGDKAVLSLEEAIEKKHFFDLLQTVPFVIKRGGDIEKALASSQYVSRYN